MPPVQIELKSYTGEEYPNAVLHALSYAARLSGFRIGVRGGLLRTLLDSMYWHPQSVDTTGALSALGTLADVDFVIEDFRDWRHISAALLSTMPLLQYFKCEVISNAAIKARVGKFPCSTLDRLIVWFRPDMPVAQFVDYWDENRTEDSFAHAVHQQVAVEYPAGWAESADALNYTLAELRFIRQEEQHGLQFRRPALNFVLVRSGNVSPLRAFRLSKAASQLVLDAEDFDRGCSRALDSIRENGITNIGIGESTVSHLTALVKSDMGLIVHLHASRNVAPELRMLIGEVPELPLLIPWQTITTDSVDNSGSTHCCDDTGSSPLVTAYRGRTTQPKPQQYLEPVTRLSNPDHYVDEGENPESTEFAIPALGAANRSYALRIDHNSLRKLFGDGTQMDVSLRLSESARYA